MLQVTMFEEQRNVLVNTIVVTGKKTTNVIDCCVIEVFNDKENGLHLVKTKSGFGITQ